MLGIGIDLVDIDRFRRVLARTPGMTKRLFTVGEIVYADRAEDPTARLAVRFAAKEAWGKGLGTGIRKGVFWRDMGVVNLPSGRPTLELTGGAAKRLLSITPQGHDARIDLTITDDFPLAQAIVIISAVSQPTNN